MKVIHSEFKRIIEPCTIEGLGFSYQFDPYAGCEHHCDYCYAQNHPDLDWEHEIGVDPEAEKETGPRAFPVNPAEPLYRNEDGPLSAG